MLLASRYGTVAGAGRKKVAVVVSTANGAAYSYDGLTWTYSAYTNTILASPTQKIAGALGPVGVAFVGTASTNPFRSSTDFVTYAEQAQPGNTVYTGDNGAWYYNGVWALGSAYTAFNTYPRVYYSTDLTTWTINDPTLAGGTNSFVQELYHDGTQWIACINGGNELQTNPDLTTSGWTIKSPPWPRTYGVAFDGTTYVWTANQTTVYTSTDLTTFTARSPGGSSFQKIAYGNGRFVVNGSILAYSTNSGVSWSAGTAVSGTQDLGFSETLGKFVLGATGGNVYISDDAVTWTSSNIGTSDDVKAVATQ
jgi:hypothetical protein